MKIVRIVALLACSAVCFLVLGQEDYAFRVLANKGSNEVKSGDAWRPLKTGAQLKLGDELKISENASVGLVSKTGKPLEVKEAKIYKIAELIGKVGNEASVLNKYTSFILSSNSAEARKNRLSATGAVHRGLDDISVQLPESGHSDVLNNIVIVRWHSKKFTGPFVVTLKDRFDEELWKTETSENFVEIDLSAPKLAKEFSIALEVAVKADPKSKSEQHYLKRLDAKKSENIKAELSKVSADLQEETAFNKYLLASVYEENKLLIDAITCYEQAIKMDAENPTYKESYDEFLLRNKIKTDK
ncbi:MAG TPA: hypothetical protein VL728_16230 [Cyclobacteriaceae bacterium]|jgi:hypothetical protein|nr:hypothetical protein [Cyclobacteriaceae bacterium]